METINPIRVEGEECARSVDTDIDFLIYKQQQKKMELNNVTVDGAQSVVSVRQAP